jgi:hypothetical protein
MGTTFFFYFLTKWSPQTGNGCKMRFLTLWGFFGGVSSDFGFKVSKKYYSNMSKKLYKILYGFEVRIRFKKC